MESHQRQINSGLTAEQVKYTTSLPVLCNVSVAGIVSVYNFMTTPFGRELVQKVYLSLSFWLSLISYVFYSQSWERCEIKNWNLSAACLTSKATQAALNDYLQTHPTLHDKIKGWTGVVHGVEDVQLDDAADTDDDTDVLLSAVIEDALGLQNIPSDVNMTSHCVEYSEKGVNNILVAAGDDEDIWAFINFDSD